MSKKRILYIVLSDPMLSGERHLWGWTILSGRGGLDIHMQDGNEMAKIVGGGVVVPAKGWRTASPKSFKEELTVPVGPERAWKEMAKTLTPPPGEGSVSAKYSGPWTGGHWRIAGPFCCPEDAAGFAADDAGQKGARIAVELWTMTSGTWKKTG